MTFTVPLTHFSRLRHFLKYIVIGPVCGFVTAGGRAGGVRTLLQPARAVFASLLALFSLCLFYAYFNVLLICLQLYKYNKKIVCS